MNDEIADLRDRLRKFNHDRDWSRYHSPKNLAMALAVETAEILELFRWMTEEESANIEPSIVGEIEQEIGDVMICLINLADKFGIDVLSAAARKLEINESNYPVEKAKGNAKKWH